MNKQQIKTLFLMRHGESVPFSSASDFDRNLTEKGVRDQERMAQLFHDKKLNMEEIWCSPFKRTKESAHLVAQKLKKGVKEEPLLGYHFDSELLIEKIQASHKDRLLLLGHEPSLALLIHKFLKKPVNFKLSTSCILQINFEAYFEWGKGDFITFYSPVDL